MNPELLFQRKINRLMRDNRELMKSVMGRYLREQHALRGNVAVIPGLGMPIGMAEPGLPDWAASVIMRPVL